MKTALRQTSGRLATDAVSDTPYKSLTSSCRLYQVTEMVIPAYRHDFGCSIQERMLQTAGSNFVIEPFNQLVQNMRVISSKALNRSIRANPLATELLINYQAMFTGRH